MATTRTAVVIVNWNGAYDTHRCLESLAAARSEWSACVVVDNGSIDGSPEILRRDFPWLQLIETGHNLGYAGGNNRGIREALQAGADWIFVLNNDTTVYPGAIEVLRSILEQDPALGAAGPKICHGDGSGRLWYAGGRVSRRPFRSSIIVRPLDEAEPYAVDYVPGCALFTSRATLEQVGDFDDRFFLTWEDTDWNARVQRAGLRTVIVPTAAVAHSGSVSFQGVFSPLYSYYYFRNMLLFAQLHFPSPERWHAYRDTIAFAWKVLRDRKRTLEPRRASAATLLGISHFFLRRFGPAPQTLTQRVLRNRVKCSAVRS